MPTKWLVAVAVLGGIVASIPLPKAPVEAPVEAPAPEPPTAAPQPAAAAPAAIDASAASAQRPRFSPPATLFGFCEG